MKTHIQAKAQAQAEGKIIREYTNGVFSTQTPGKTVETVYKPDGTVYRIAMNKKGVMVRYKDTESLDALYAYEYPRK